MANLSNRWNAYRPSKPVWLWSCVGAGVFTMIVGFGFGGWVTGGTAQERAETSTHDAVAALAADVCTQRVLASANAAALYSELEAARSWDRRKLLDEAGWTTFSDAGEPISGAAALCATQILATEMPASAPDAPLADAGTGQASQAAAHDAATRILSEEAKTVS